jgi:hypothetical protein
VNVKNKDENVLAPKSVGKGKTGNLKIIFACQPGNKTDGASKLSEFVYTECIRCLN